ncbi:MAG TPA: CAP domain-containing protein [Ilumatobacteraceae bacterium]|nr:CAP domain-containing protein [Ilumatobacteraceae bacterium]
MGRCIIAAASIGAVLFAGQLPSSSPVSAATATSWLSTVNAYRAMSGLAPVTENTTWSAEGYAHSCYMLANGISHDEVPGNPGYTPGGDTAGNSGNVAVSSNTAATPRDHIDLWMTGPFHAIGILRPQLATSGFGICADGSAPAWHSGGTLDVLRGINPQIASPTSATVFPGRNATLALDRFRTESPNPLEFCGWTGTAAGLPLFAMMPGAVTSASAALSGPAGPVQTCVLHGENTNGSAQSILRSANAVIVVPRSPLAPGTYTSTVNSTGGNVTWSFTIDPNAVLQPPSIVLPDTAPASARSSFQPVEPYRYADSREARKVVPLRAGVPTTVDFGDAAITAVSANFTVDRPSASGFLTVYNCSAAVPTVSTLNFTASAVPNQAFVALSQGKLCLYSPVDTDIIIDINGYFRAGSGGNSSGFYPVAPTRLYDTRPADVLALEPGVPRTIAVEGVPGGAPANANAVAVNLTVVAPSGYGFIRAYPCDQAASSEVSNVNFEPLENRPNSAIIPTSASGTICIVSNAPTDLLVDLAGYFVAGNGYQFTPLMPVRLLDTRSPYPELNPDTNGSTLVAGQIVRLAVAGNRGIPANAKAVSVNVTAAGADGAGFVTVYPCGTVPNVSNLNFSASTPAIANGALVPLGPSGEVCLFTSNAVHLIVDINGVWN